MAEAGDLKSPECGFESRRGHVSKPSVSPPVLAPLRAPRADRRVDPDAADPLRPRRGPVHRRRPERPRAGWRALRRVRVRPVHLRRHQPRRRPADRLPLVRVQRARPAGGPRHLAGDGAARHPARLGRALRQPVALDPGRRLQARLPELPAQHLAGRALHRLPARRAGPERRHVDPGCVPGLRDPDLDRDRRPAQGRRPPRRPAAGDQRPARPVRRDDRPRPSWSSWRRCWRPRPASRCC